MPNSLEKRFPNAKNIARTSISVLPTPVQKVCAGNDFSLWIKRDDLTSADYGGNKIRKLEYLFGDAKKTAKTEVWTVGAIGSHHVLATCIHAQNLGFKSAALHFPQPITEHVRTNIKALSTTHPKLHLIGHKTGLPKALFKVKLKEWLSTEPQVYYIPGGGSSAMGTLGYVNAALELCDQIDEGHLPCPDEVYVAAGTCGTLAGLTLGFAMAGKKIKTIGVRVVEKFVSNIPLACRLANQTSDILRAHHVDAPKLKHADFHIINDAFGAGYGLPTDEGMKCVQAYKNIVKLEPTYTAKTVAAMHRFAKPNLNILYWHTLSGADLSKRVQRADLSNLPDTYLDFFEDSQ